MSFGVAQGLPGHVEPSGNKTGSLPHVDRRSPDNMGSISDKVSAIDVSAVISFEQEPENHQYYRVFPAVRDDIVAEHTAATQTLQRPRGLAGERSAYVHNSIAALAAKSPIT